MKHVPEDLMKIAMLVGPPKIELEIALHGNVIAIQEPMIMGIQNNVKTAIILGRIASVLLISKKLVKLALEETQKINAQVVIPVNTDTIKVDIVSAMIIITMMEQMNNVVCVIPIGSFIFIKFIKSLTYN